MAISHLKRAVSTKETPQSQPVFGKAQVQNDAGGYVFETSDMSALERFLIIGTEGNTYYADEAKMTKDNLDRTMALIAKNGVAVVDKIVEVSDAGRAPKNDPAIFALALCASFGDDETKAKAFANVNKVCRIGTHLMHFVAFLDEMRGWGRAPKRAVANWFLSRSPERLADQVIKYQSRDGWSMRDLVRLAHLGKGGSYSDPAYGEIFNWISNGWESIGEKPHPNPALRPIWAFERLKALGAENSEYNPRIGKAIADIMVTYGLPMEAIPTHLRGAEVYEAAMETNKLTWLIRNLGNLSSKGVLSVGNKALERAVSSITDPKALKDGRIHPITILNAMNTYASGKGAKGSGTWPVIQEVVDALDEGFYLAFDNVTKTNKRYMVCLDVSDSMTWHPISKMPGLTPRVASAALAMVHKTVEPTCHVKAFSHTLVDFPMSKKERLDSVIRRMASIPMGGTNASLPFLHATAKNLEVDTFIIYTDSQSWAGKIHTYQALENYRQASGIDARFIVNQMEASSFTLADPDDPLSMDLVGLDSAAPEVIAQFSLGNI